MAPPITPTTLKATTARFSDRAFLLLQNILMLLVFVVVVFFVQGTAVLATAAAAQAVLTAMLGQELSNALDLAQWHLMAGQTTRTGIPFVDMLAISRTTGYMGTFALLRAPSSQVGISAKTWGLARVAVTAMILLAGILVNTSTVTVYDTAHTFNVTAGVGPFNSSLVDPFVKFIRSLAPQYPYQVQPFSYIAWVYILLLNPLTSTVASPVRCPGEGGCTSYLLSGGLSMVAPWVRQGFDDHTLVKIANAPAVQLDFTGPVDSAFGDADCDGFGQSGVKIGIRFCLSQSSPDPAADSLYAQTERGAGLCHGDPPAPNITTIVAFYTTKATVVAARSNYSIVSITGTDDLPAPVERLNTTAYRGALRWLLNCTDADMPPPSSVAQSFWSSSSQLRDPSTHSILTQHFQSILAFPFGCSTQTIGATLA
ncbi:hypothetical protein B0H63DRAFT_556259 [Podospora didyma]|uniref:Uncharacterized protein n=1 Tax=Podospora didyma TaxID=330526 RepID=A0AAE0U983_9PEZI|nr:hypothetical protein B0H63DRAFT_556259 [Podospora didyma]